MNSEWCYSSSSLLPSPASRFIHLMNQVPAFEHSTYYRVCGGGGRIGKTPSCPPYPLKFSFLLCCDVMFNYRWQGLAWVQRKTVSSSLLVHAWQDASSRPPFSPLLWLWLPPDVTPLLVTAQPPVADLVVLVYLSQLCSSAVNSEEFHTSLNCCSYFKSNSIKCKATCNEKYCP